MNLRDTQLLQPLKNMRITFWGVQGSCPLFPAPHEVEQYAKRISLDVLQRVFQDIDQKAKAGHCSAEQFLGGPITPHSVEQYYKRLGMPEVPVYGGETTCIEVETSDGYIIILDGGSGIRHCALNIENNKWKNKKNRELYVFGSHEHLDHRSGLPFARICFARPDPFKLHIYGSNPFLTALDDRFALFSHIITPSTHLDDPLDYRMMSATFKAYEISNPDEKEPLPEPSPHWDRLDIRETIQIGKTTIKAFDVYHGMTRCLAYKLEHNDKTFIFCTDHETRHPAEGTTDQKQRISLAADNRITTYSMNADVAYFDGQYFLAEYQGQKGIGSSPPVPRLDWGHSCIEDVIERAEKCRIKRTFIGHHDPERDWGDRMRIDAELAAVCKGKDYHIELAKGGAVVDL